MRTRGNAYQLQLDELLPHNNFEVAAVSAMVMSYKLRSLSAQLAVT